MKYVMAMIIILGSVAVSCSGFNSIVEATNQKRAAIDVAKQVTQQTEIEWAGRVDIAEIEADRDVDIAGIHRDEVIWSSWSWNIFSVIRALLWVLGILCVVWVLVHVTGFQLA